MKTQALDRVHVIKARAHPTRLKIAEILSAKETSCVSDLHQQVGGDLSTVSKHLTIMRQAGWVSCQKSGLKVHYQMACGCLDEFLRCIDTLASSSSSQDSNCC